MGAPTWDELRSRNASASGLYVSGSMHVTGETDRGSVDDRFTFWHGPGDRWWVERNGEIAYVSSTAEEGVPVARIDDHMVYQRKNNHIGLGRVFSPEEAFGPRSLLVSRGRGLRVINGPRETEFDGRLSWAVGTATPAGTVTDLVFDDRTAIVVQVSSKDHDRFLCLTDLVDYDELPASRFVWNGPAIESDELRTAWLKW